MWKEFQNVNHIYFTTGYYMYIETSSPRVQGDYARLTSPMQQFSGFMCLRFFYHMYGATIGRLYVTINGRSVFSRSGNQGNKWIEAGINTYITGVYPVRNIFNVFGIPSPLLFASGFKPLINFYLPHWLGYLCSHRGSNLIFYAH